MAVGVNFVVLFSYWFFYSYRNASSSGAAQEDVPQSVKGDGLDDKQSDLQKRGLSASLERPVFGDDKNRKRGHL